MTSPLSPGGDPQIVDGAVQRIQRDDTGPKGTEGIETLPPAELAAGPGFLPPASGNVVGAGDSENRAAGIEDGPGIQIATRLADHDGEFTLEVDLFSFAVGVCARQDLVRADARDADRLPGQARRGGVLGEQHRAIGDGGALLIGVCLVVASDADDVPDRENIVGPQTHTDRRAERRIEPDQIHRAPAHCCSSRSIAALRPSS